MSSHRKTLLYIAGPMTGIENHNVEAFNAAEHILTMKGYAVLNPARHEQDGREWTDYMKLGLADVIDADHIALLPGWNKSKGALLECYVADGLGKTTEPIDYWITKDN